MTMTLIDMTSCSGGSIIAERYQLMVPTHDRNHRGFKFLPFTLTSVIGPVSPWLPLSRSNSEEGLASCELIPSQMEASR